MNKTKILIIGGLLVGIPMVGIICAMVYVMGLCKFLMVFGLSMVTSIMMVAGFNLLTK